MEGRAAAISSGWPGCRPLQRRSSSSIVGQAMSETQSHNDVRETRGVGAEKTVPKDGKKITLCGDLSGTYQRKAGVVEELDRRASGDGDDWRLRNIFLHDEDEDEDGVNGGRMKPLASFDVNRGLPPPVAAQSRKLKIRLSTADDDPVPAVARAVPKAIHRAQAQDKENGGLVPLCPGTTQITGIKRKTVSSKDVKPQGRKRIRVVTGARNTTDQGRKGPSVISNPGNVVEVEGDKTNGMDLLLLAMKAAEPKCQRSEVPCLPPERPIVLQGVNAERPPRPERPSQNAGQKNKMPTSTLEVMSPYRPAVQPSPGQTKAVIKNQRLSAEEEELQGTRCRDTHGIETTTRPAVVMVRSKDQHKTKKAGSAEKGTRGKDEITTKLQQYRPASAKRPGAKGRHQLGSSKGKETSCSDDDLEMYAATPFRYQCDAVISAAVQTKGKLEVSNEEQGKKSSTDEDLKSSALHSSDVDFNSSDEDFNSSDEDFNSSKEMMKNVMKPHRYVLSSHEAADELRQKFKARGEKEPIISVVPMDARQTFPYFRAPFEEALVSTKGKIGVKNEVHEGKSSTDEDLYSSDEDSHRSDEDFHSSDEEMLMKNIMKPHRYILSSHEAAENLRQRFKARGEKESIISVVPMDARKSHPYLWAPEAVNESKEEPEGSKGDKAYRHSSDERVEKTAMNLDEFPAASSTVPLVNRFEPGKERVMNLQECPVAPATVPLDKINAMLEASKEDKAELPDSDEDSDCTDDEMQYYRKLHRYKVTLTDAAEELRRKIKARGEKEPIIHVGDDLYMPALSKVAPDESKGQPEAHKVEQAKKDSSDLSHSYSVALCTLSSAKIKETPEASKKHEAESTHRDEDLNCTDKEMKYYMKPHRYKVTSDEAAEERKWNLEGRKEGQPTCSDDDLDKYAAKPQCSWLAPSEEAVEDLKRVCEIGNKQQAGPSCSDTGLDKYARKPHQYGHMAFKEALRMKRGFEARRQNEVEPSCSDDDLDKYARKPHRYRPGVSKETLIKSRLQPTRKDKENNESIVKPLHKLLPSHAKVLLSQGQNIIHKTQEREEISGLSCTIAIDSHRQMPETKPLDDNAKELPKVVESAEHPIQESNDVQYLSQDSIWMKYPWARHQLTRKESSTVAGNVLGQQPCNSKKRKASDHLSAFCVVPKQVATASCLLETGEPSHPSVGAVVVECLTPSIEQKKQGRTAVCNMETEEAFKSHNSFQRPTVQSGKELTNREVDNKKGSCVSGQGKGEPLMVAANQEQNHQVALSGDGDISTIEKISTGNQSSTQCAQKQGDDASNCVAQGIKGTVPLCGGSSSTIPRVGSFVRICGRRNLADLSSTKSVLIQSSKSHLIPAGPKASHSSTLQYSIGSFQQKKYSSDLSGESVPCSGYNEDDATHHEIAGIKMQRRSWEALKAAEFLAKRRFSSQKQQTSGINVPSIPSRFHQANDLVQGVQNVNPRLGTHCSNDAVHLPSSACSTRAVVDEKNRRQRRGPRKSQHERLATKVLNKSVENFVQLKDASCPSGVGFNCPTQTQNRCHDSDPPTYSGAPKVPPLKTRQRRGHKKLQKEKVKNTNTKTNNIAYKFKPLTEPSGLLSGCNPGIMQRVRKIEQIHAILGALIGAASSNEAREFCPSISPPKVLPQKRAQESACVTMNPEGTGEQKGNSLQGQARNPEEKQLNQSKNHAEQRLAMGGTIDNQRLSQSHCVEPPEAALVNKEVLLFSGTQNLAEEVKTHQGRPDIDNFVPATDEVINPDSLQERSEPLTQRLSTVSPDCDYTEDDEQEMQPMSGTSSSPAAAGLAAQWLDLLTLDIQGRLSALEQSRERVRGTLQSGQLGSDSRNPSVPLHPPSTSSLDVDAIGSQQSVSSNPKVTEARQDNSLQEVDRFRALLTNMDGVLGKEASKLVRSSTSGITKVILSRNAPCIDLDRHQGSNYGREELMYPHPDTSNNVQESSLWQIQQMQAFCPGCTQQPVCAPEALHPAHCKGEAPEALGIENQPPYRWPLTMEAMEKEVGLAASAASILSTASFVSKAQSFR